MTAKEAHVKRIPDDIVEIDHETPSAITSNDAQVEVDQDTVMEYNQAAPDTEWNGFDQADENEDQPTLTMDLDDDSLPTFFHDEDQDIKAKTLNAKPGSKRNRKGKVAMLIKEKVNRVLAETELGDKRARMCDEGDFLKLLWAFNQEGIHFS